MFLVNAVVLSKHSFGLIPKVFDTVDVIADTVGIAKASLYRHFPSKEALGMAALVDIMHKTLEVINQLNATDQTAIDKLKALTQWAMRLKLAQKMPNLPSENSQLRELLIANDDYTNNLVMLSDSIGEWIEQAQAEGKLQSNIPGLAILYTLYARACDPVLGFLRSSQLYDDDEIIAIVTRTCFEGLT